MPIQGDLRTMSLADLLQWAGQNHKTGVLELEHNRVLRRIEFRKGWVTACSADDPPNRLGQFLLSRGKITAEHLRAALAEQETSPRNLGLILHQQGVLTQAELAQQIAAKAEELVQSLFDWSDALFRFHDGATLDPDQIEVRLSVRELLMRGLQHHDELRQIREVFPSSGTVLRRTERQAPSEITERAVARRIYESIDGHRTLAEVLLHAHAAEFLVLKLLYRLRQAGLVEVTEVGSPPPGMTTLLDQVVAAAPLATDEPCLGTATPDRASRDPEAPRAVEARPTGDSLTTEIDVAQRLLSRGEHEAALELLQATYRAHPGDSYVKGLITQAEAAFVTSVRGHELAPDRIPVPGPQADELRQQLGPQEAFLFSLVDGRTDIKSMLWLTPLHEVEALKAMRRMLESGLIALAELRPEAAPAVPLPLDLGEFSAVES